VRLEEAIKHCEEVAEAEEQKLKDWKGDYSHLQKIDSCKECAKVHLQLAEWLRELKAYRKAREEIIRKKDSSQWSELVVHGFSHAIHTIDNHLKEVTE
jgi:hypothetical protein